MSSNKEQTSTENNKYENETDYIDEFVELNKDCIIIKKMYYPLSKQKVIKLKDIKNVKLITLDRSNGKYTFLGLCWKFIWYHLDRKRPLKSTGIVIEEKDSVIKIGLTPEHVEKCYAILSSLVKKESLDTELINLNKKEKSD